MPELIEKLEVKNIEHIFSEPMSRHTTFRVGGPADIAVWPKNEDEAVFVLDLFKDKKHIVIGNGSNVVFPDSGYGGAVIFTERMSDISLRGNSIHAQCGVKLSALANAAKDAGLHGLEFAHGIPGTLGGAVFMNAGAYGGEMKNAVKKVRYWDGGGIGEISEDKLDFGYRSSFFSKNRGCVIFAAELLLCPGEKSEIEQEMAELMARRREKQPLNYPSAGSVFKRPEGYFAGKLIEDAGLKGRRCGGMAVSEKHAGFIVNTGGGTETELRKLISEVQQEVYERFGVMLETEVKFVD